MSGIKYLLDSSCLALFLANRLNVDDAKFVFNIINADINISIITKIELLSFKEADENYSNSLKILFANASIYTLDDDVVLKTVSLRKSGKTKLPDCIIAATAIAKNFTLITADRKDFKAIKKLKVHYLNHN